jgi:short-subunit dehydrogenase
MKNKVVIITGASSGIGRATALLLSGQGARVVLAARNRAALKKLEREIQALDGTALVVPTDVMLKKDIKNLVQKTIKQWGRIDVVIANAGQYIQGYIAQINEQPFMDSMKINFYGAVSLIQAVLPYLLAQKSGHIVLINTLDSKKGIVGDAPYVAAKSALAGFGEVLRQELNASGIAVMSVFPGRVDTPMIGELTVPGISAKIPPEQVAKAILRGIKRHKAEVIVPGFYSPLTLLNELAPRVVDWFYRILKLQGSHLSENDLKSSS